MAGIVISGLSAIIVALIGLIGVMWSTNKNVKQTVTNTTPTGNGFAKHVMEGLSDIQETQGAHGAQLEALAHRVERVELKADIWDRRKW